MHSLLIHPDALIPENCFTILWEELKIIPGTNDRVNYILEFCKPYLREQNTITVLLADFKDENLNPIKAS